jgi:hypothetical protein
MQHFHNTLRLNFPEVQIEEEKAKNGDAIVLALFSLNPNAEMTPREVFTMITHQGYNYELTSVRRSITNLTIAGKLEKLDKQKKECKGTNNFLWRLKNE